MLGALISEAPLHWDIVFAFGAAMLGVGFANSFNSLIDRFQDRLNPNKHTLAMEKPVTAWYGVLFLLPILAICLRSNAYNHRLFAILYYLCFAYSYSLGRVRVLKRVVVAAIIALTSLLYAQTYSLALWLFASFAFVYFFIRETGKDRADKEEDNLVRFKWQNARIDWWCISAPFLVVGIYLGCLYWARQSIGLTDAVVSFGMGVSAWSYVQIRYRYRHYHMHLLHQTTGGRLGAVIALVGLMPTFVTPAFVLVVLFNTCTIVYRSFLNKGFTFERIAVAHDAYLWASLPLLVMAKVGFQPALVCLSIAIGTFTYLRESRRLCIIRQAC